MGNFKTAIILGFVKKDNEYLLINAIKSLQQQTYKDFDIFIYDNSTLDNSLAETRKLFPTVTVKKNPKNLGFAGGNNSVIRDLLKDDKYKYIVLQNDDTNPSREWIETLINTAELDANIGAVTSKLIYYEDFIRLELETQSINLAHEGLSNDDRDLGIIFFENTTLQSSNYQKRFQREGFYPRQDEDGRGAYWIKSHARIDLPIGSATEKKYQLNLKIKKNKYINDQSVNLKIGDYETTIHLSNKVTYKIAIPAEVINKYKFSLIQNAGSGITAQFDGYDIGSINNSPEKDIGQYDEQKEVPMFCGGAVLLNASALRKVGIFDEYFFVYYEDADLSLRLKKQGYSIIYQPKAVIRHIHAGSSGEYSPFFSYHVWKNKPAFVIKNFGIRPSVFALNHILLKTFKDIIQASRRLFSDSYKNNVMKVQLRSFGFFMLNLPIIYLKKFRIIKSV